MTLSRSFRGRLAVPVLAAATVLGSVAGCATTISGQPSAAGPGVSAGQGSGERSAPTTPAGPAVPTAPTTDTSAEASTRPPPTSTTLTDRTAPPSARDTGSVPPPVDGEPVDPQEYARLVQKGTAGITSMTFALTTKAAGQTIKISGVETVRNGVMTAARMKIGGVMSLEFLLVDGKVYQPAQCSRGRRLPRRRCLDTEDPGGHRPESAVGDRQEELVEQDPGDRRRAARDLPEPDRA